MLAANFIEETTTSIAGTSGDGAITMSAITGKPRFQTALGTGKRWVRYVIEDTVNNKFEQGLGYVTSGVLTRSRPQVTWDGTTWNDKAPTALQFGATPTAGNILIRMAPTAEATAPTIHARQTAVAGEATWRDYRFSAHFDGLMGATASNALVADMLYSTAYRLDTAGLLSGLKIEVTTGIAASSIKWALSDIGADGLPGAKIVDGNIIDTATSGFKTDSTISTWNPANGVWLPPGWYALTIIASGAVSIRTANQKGGQTPFGLTSLSYGHGEMIYATGSYTSGIPADLSSTMAGGTLHPKNSTAANQLIGLRVVQ